MGDSPGPELLRTVGVIGLLGGRPVGDPATAALRGAALVVGGEDQLAAVSDLLHPACRTAVVGAGLTALDELQAHPGPACVLASGDPGFFGIVRALAARLGEERLAIYPAPSSVALAFARLGLPWDGAVVRSCHAGSAARAAAEVAGAKVAAVLTGPDAPPEELGAALAGLGAHHQLVVVATRLGEAGEQIVRCNDLDDLASGRFDHRSVVVLAHPAQAHPTQAHPTKALASSAFAGRPIADFAHRASMITKPEVRSIVLDKLALPDRGVMWDVGAGSGSVAIEASLLRPGLRVIAIERDPTDADRALSNAAAHGALLEVVNGQARDVLADLPVPDRVFVGGGGVDVVDACLAALAPGGRLVATFAAADRAVAAHRRLGNMVQVGVSHAEELPDGGIRFRADNPVFVAWGDAGVAEGRREEPTSSARVVVGVGCSMDASANEVASLVSEALAANPGAANRGAANQGPAYQELAAADSTDPTVEVATIDSRLDHPAIREAASGRRLIGFPTSLLRAVEVPNPSQTVDEVVGTPSVAEAAALLGAGPGARLTVAKRKGPAATAAVAVAARSQAPGRSAGVVRVVGLGPGGACHRTPAAVSALRGSDAVIGYGPYVDSVAYLLRPEQVVVRGTMGAEADRALAALALAGAGWRVALVSSGDPGVFAMAARTLDLAAGRSGVAIEIVPGVTAAHAAAAVAAAPMRGAQACVSLSDLHLPWERIEAQLLAAATTGMAIALYNPRSAGRPDHLARAAAILSTTLPPITSVALVTDATGENQDVIRTTLSELDPSLASMRSIVLVDTADAAEGCAR